MAFLFVRGRRRLLLLVLMLVVLVAIGVGAFYFYRKSQEILLPNEVTPGEVALSKDFVDNHPEIKAYIEKSGYSLVPGEQVVPGEYAVRLVEGVAEEAFKTYLESIGGTLVARFGSSNTFFVKLPESYDTQGFDPKVISAVEQNVRVAVDQAQLPNDPSLSQQWALESMQVFDVWNDFAKIDKTPKQYKVAVLDTGACFDHQDLAGIFLNEGFDFVNQKSDPVDDHGHGCMVAGVIAAVKGNGLGISGIAPNVKVVPYKVCNAQGSCSVLDSALAVYDALSKGVSVINMSFGGGRQIGTFEQAIEFAVKSGVTVVASAGNKASSVPQYPAAYNGVVAVGSVDKPGNVRSWFSNYGAYVDAWAPGGGILTTALNNQYKIVSGTSFAAPYYVGLVALEGAFCRTVQPIEGTQTVVARADLGFDLESCYPNTAPVITSQPPLAVYEGDEYKNQLTVSDAEGDQLTYSLVTAPVGMEISATGLIYWRSPARGQHSVVARVVDPRGASAQQEYTITVNQKTVVNPPPSLPQPIGYPFFQNAQAEYAVWQQQNPGFVCAATVMQTQSTKGSFEVWYCGVLPGGFDLGLLVMNDANMRATDDRKPVKYQSASGNFINYGGRITTPTGWIYGYTSVIDGLRALGWP